LNAPPTDDRSARYLAQGTKFGLQAFCEDFFTLDVSIRYQFLEIGPEKAAVLGSGNGMENTMRYS